MLVTQTLLCSLVRLLRVWWAPLKTPYHAVLGGPTSAFRPHLRGEEFVEKPDVWKLREVCSTHDFRGECDDKPGSSLAPSLRDVQVVRVKVRGMPLVPRYGIRRPICRRR